jgi:hypothetical protein
MNKGSWIIHNLCGNCLTDYDYRCCAFLRLGATLEEKPDSNLCLPEGSLEADRLCVVAEEVLLRKVCQEPIPDAVLYYLKDIRPFGSDFPSLDKLIQSNASVAVFPLLDTNGGKPGVAHIWLFEADLLSGCPDHSDYLQGINVSNSAEDLKVFVSSSNTKSTICGESWQLAFAMARKGLYDLDLRKKIAQNWIFTGKVRGDHISEIEIGNKMDLHTERTWLIPRENSDGAPFGKKIRTAGNIDEAYAWVTGQGIHRSGIVEWPKAVFELHSFVSRGVRPVIAAAVLSQAERIVLWHSDNEDESLEPAWCTYKMLKELLPEKEVLEPKLISSKDLYEAEKTLGKYLSSRDTIGKVVFNITQGNRLMSLAPHYLARMDSNIWLVYRDYDCMENLQYVGIHYKQDGDSPTTMFLDKSDLPLNVCWDLLYGKAVQDLSGWYAQLLAFLNSKTPMSSWE